MNASAGRFRADMTAALTVAFVGLPQCLAYAMMSGLPPAYGLATAAVPGFVAALVGKSPHIVTGPTNTTGLLILAALGPYLGANGLLGVDGLSALATLTLMAGAVRIAAAIAGGGALVDFIPESVLAGFTAGAGVLIAVMQIDEGLGLQGVRSFGIFSQFSEVGTHVVAGEVAWPALVVVGGTVAVVMIGRRIRPSFPAALFAVVVATAIAFAFGLDAMDGLPIISDRAPMPRGWPIGALPSLDPTMLRGFLGPAAAIGLLGTMELAVSARRGGARPDMRREILAQGAANVVGAFTSAFPASASLTRSALLELGGARTRLAAAVAALVMVPILFFGGSAVAALPQASLAGVLFVTAIQMINPRRIARIWSASTMTRSLLATTFVSTLVLPLEWAVFLGVAFGVGQYLASSRRPRVGLLAPRDRRLIPITPDEAGDVVVIEVSGDCHFAAAGQLHAGVEGVLPATARHVVIDLSHARALRYAALMVFEQLEEQIAKRGGTLHLAGVPEPFVKLMRSTGSALTAAPYEDEPLSSVWTVLDWIALTFHDGSTL